MTAIFVEITTSLDGYVAGPNATLEEPLGADGERIHEWLVGLASFRELHGGTGGEVNTDSDLLEQSFRRSGAVVMGRRMFSGGAGPWEDDPNAKGWWGDDPPFRKPVFVLTSHPREPLELGRTTFTFVTDGVDAALEQARTAAGDKDVQIAGGANVVQQVLEAGYADELNIHVAPLLLGGGVRLFDGGTRTSVPLECVSVVDSPKAVHLKYRVIRN
jgi:dihydrofolate reductase